MMRKCMFSLAIIATATTTQAGPWPTASDLAAMMVDRVSSVCPVQAPDFVARYPDIFAGTAARIISEPAEEDWLPPSPEHLQIITYVMVQATQVVEMLSYDAHVRQVYDGEGTFDPQLRSNAHVITDLAECLIPRGPAFSEATEPGITELANLTTKDVLCQKWYEYSIRLLALPVPEMSFDDYLAAWQVIGEETIGRCED